MNEQINRFLERAAYALEAADLLLQHEYELALANRAYYAVFYCISALLLSKNVVVKSHEGARGKFHELFIKTRQFEVETSKLVARIAETRQSADYDMDVDITEEQAQQLLNDARRFYDLKLAYFREYPVEWAVLDAPTGVELTIRLLVEVKRTHMNLWSEVPYADYERHMSHETVGQLALLNEITGEKIAQWYPQTVAVYGACMGNGFTHFIDVKVDNTPQTRIAPTTGSREMDKTVRLTEAWRWLSADRLMRIK